MLCLMLISAYPLIHIHALLNNRFDDHFKTSSHRDPLWSGQFHTKELNGNAIYAPKEADFQLFKSAKLISKIRKSCLRISE